MMREHDHLGSPCRLVLPQFLPFVDFCINDSLVGRNWGVQSSVGPEPTWHRQL